MIWNRQERMVPVSPCDEDGEQFYLIHNEAPRGSAEAVIAIQGKGEVLLWDVMSGQLFCPDQEETMDGRIRLKLTFEQYELKVLYLPGTKILTERIAKIARAEEHNASWEIEYPDGVVEKSEGNIPVRPENHTGPVSTENSFTERTCLLEIKFPDWLYLGALSDCCEVFLNGGSLGKRAAAPLPLCSF